MTVSEVGRMALLTDVGGLHDTQYASFKRVIDLAFALIGTVVLAADCCYLKQTLDTLHLPRSRYKADQMLESLSLLRRMQSDGARIFFGHDSEFWKTVPQAPYPVT